MSTDHYKLTNETMRHLCNHGYVSKLDPNRLTRDHQIIVCHHGGKKGMSHLLNAKTLHHDTKFYVARYGTPEHTTILNTHHQPLDDKTQHQLKATESLDRGDATEYNKTTKYAQNLWASVKHTMKDVD